MKEKHTHTHTHTHTQKQIEKNKGDKSYSEIVRAKWFCCAFKLGFLQLICKASLIFKSNLELALLIILKERELYMSQSMLQWNGDTWKFETCYPFRYVPQS